MDQRQRGQVRMRGGRGNMQQRGGGGRARARQVISDEIRATIIDHVLVHGLTMREAGMRVQPNLSRFTVSSIVQRFRATNKCSRPTVTYCIFTSKVVLYCTAYYSVSQVSNLRRPNTSCNNTSSFCRIERLPYAGGRPRIFSHQQETLIVNMVLQNNIIRLREIRQRVIEDNVNFEGINTVSISTIDCVLQRNRVRLKQVYRVPFERNSERLKEHRYQFVQVSAHADDFTTA